MQKRAQSPMAGKKLAPIYMDLAYVPHHGNSYYSHVEFFKKIRARYYVFSGTEPSKEVYNALLEAKQTWEDQNLGELANLLGTMTNFNGEKTFLCRGNNHPHLRHRCAWLLGIGE